MKRTALILSLCALPIIASATGISHSLNVINVLPQSHGYRVNSEALVSHLHQERVVIHQPKSNLLVFATLTMPDTSLKQLLFEAHRAHVPVIIRGLYKNSFVATAKRIFNLTKDKNIGGIEIDPLWFEEFHITTVPAFVLTQGQCHYSTTVPCHYDVVHGNVSIETALNWIANNGTLKTLAKAKLSEINKGVSL